MTRKRPATDVGAALDAWMADVAPTTLPDRVLEESFARTMATRQSRRYPWHWVARWGRWPRQTVRFGFVAGTGFVIVALVVGLLGGGAGVGPAPSATPDRTPTPATSPSAPVAVPVPVTPTAAVAVTSPVGLATDGNVVWALTGSGRIVPIDPATNVAAPGVQLGTTTDLFQDIAVDTNGVWATDSSARMLYRVDPATLKVVARIPAGEVPKGVLATGSAVWVADSHGGTVLRIDPSTNTVVATTTIGPARASGPNWLAGGLGSIWVGVPNDSTVVRIDQVTSAIQARIAVPGAGSPCGGFAITDTAVWIPSCDVGTTMARIDPATNTVVGTVELGGHGYSPVIIGGAPWVALDMSPIVLGPIARVAPDTNAVDIELSPGPDFGGGGDIVVAAGSAWVIDDGNDRVLRLPLAAFASR